MIPRKISKPIWIPVLIISLLTGLYFGSYGIIHRIIKSQLSTSQISENPEINSITILSMGDQYMTIDLQILLPPQLQQSISIQLKTTSIYINESLVGFLAIISPSYISFNHPLQHIELNFTFSDHSIFIHVLQEIINEADLLLRIETKLFLGGLGRIYPPFSLEFEKIIQTRPPQQTSSFFTMTLQNVMINTETGVFSFGLNVSIKNPLNNSIGITAFQGNLTFNDPDGTFLVVPKSHIPLIYLNFTWNDPPFSLPPNEIGSRLIEINATTSLETAFRLFDEYFLNGRMIINLEAAKMVLEIADYTWNFPFSLLGRNLV
jgi:uncharacterized protein YneF (UPF0154 family)